MYADPMIITDNGGFLRTVLDASPAIGVDEHGVWLLDVRMPGYRWHVEATLADGAWNVLTMTPKDPA
jgi:hypothetical protein